MTLPSRASAVPVFLGVMSAFLLVDGLSALLGGELLLLLSHNILGLVSGLIFTSFSTVSLFYKSGSIIREQSGAKFIQTFSSISIMELGDKTQIASAILAAQFGNPIMFL